MQIRADGLTVLIGDLRDLPEAQERSVILGLSQVGFDSAQRGAGRHFNTGALFQSLYNRASGTGRAVGHDPVRAPHAAFVVFGTRPHRIVPKKRKALRWVGPRGFVFAKGVNHPGYAGDDYMIEARDDALAQLPALSAKALRDNL